MSTPGLATKALLSVLVAAHVETAATASKTLDKKDSTELAAKILDLSVSTGVSASWQNDALRIAAYPRDPDVWAQGLALDAATVEAAKRLHNQRIAAGQAQPPNAIFTYSPQEQYKLFKRMKHLTKAHGGKVFVRLNRGLAAISVAENGYLEMPGLKQPLAKGKAFAQSDLSRLFEQAARHASDFTEAMVTTGRQDTVRRRSWLVGLTREGRGHTFQIRARYDGRLLNGIKAAYLFPLEASPGRPVRVNVRRTATRVFVLRRK